MAEEVQKTDDFNEFIRLLKSFAQVREGCLLRSKKDGIQLPLLREYAASNKAYSSNGGFSKRVSLKEGDCLFLYQIETSGVENVYYIWNSSKLPSEPYYEKYEKHVVDNYMRNSLETLTFYFLVQQGEETKKCYLVLCNETINSMRVFFSLFDLVGYGLDDALLQEATRTKNNNTKTLQMSFSWNKLAEEDDGA